MSQDFDKDEKKDSDWILYVPPEFRYTVKKWRWKLIHWFGGSLPMEDHQDYPATFHPHARNVFKNNLNYDILSTARFYPADYSISAQHKMAQSVVKHTKPPDVRVDIVQGSHDPFQAPRLHRVMDLFDKTALVPGRNRLIDIVHDPQNVFITMEIDNMLAGAVGFRTELKEGHAELLGLATAFPYQNQGVAGYLMRTMESILRENEVEVVFSSVPITKKPLFEKWGFSPFTNYVTDWMAFNIQGVHRLREYRVHERDRKGFRHLEYAEVPVMIEKHLSLESRIRSEYDPEPRQRHRMLEIDSIRWYHESETKIPDDYQRYGIWEGSRSLREANQHEMFLRNKFSMADPNHPVLNFLPDDPLDLFDRPEDLLFNDIDQHETQQKTLQKVEILNEKFPGIEWETMYPNLAADKNTSQLLEEEFLEKKRHDKRLKGLRLQRDDFLWHDNEPDYAHKKQIKKYLELRKQARVRRSQGLRTLNEIEIHGYDLGLYLTPDVIAYQSEVPGFAALPGTQYLPQPKGFRDINFITGLPLIAPPEVQPYQITAIPVPIMNADGEWYSQDGKALTQAEVQQYYQDQRNQRQKAHHQQYSNRQAIAQHFYGPGATGGDASGGTGGSTSGYYAGNAQGQSAGYYQVGQNDENYQNDQNGGKKGFISKVKDLFSFGNGLVEPTSLSNVDGAIYSHQFHAEGNKPSGRVEVNHGYYTPEGPFHTQHTPLSALSSSSGQAQSSSSQSSQSGQSQSSQSSQSTPPSYQPQTLGSVAPGLYNTRGYQITGLDHGIVMKPRSVFTNVTKNLTSILSLPPDENYDTSDGSILIEIPVVEEPPIWKSTPGTGEYSPQTLWKPDFENADTITIKLPPGTNYTPTEGTYLTKPHSIQPFGSERMWAINKDNHRSWVDDFRENWKALKKDYNPIGLLLLLDPKIPRPSSTISLTDPGEAIKTIDGYGMQNYYSEKYADAMPGGLNSVASRWRWDEDIDNAQYSESERMINSSNDPISDEVLTDYHEDPLLSFGNRRNSNEEYLWMRDKISDNPWNFDDPDVLRRRRRVGREKRTRRLRALWGDPNKFETSEPQDEGHWLTGTRRAFNRLPYHLHTPLLDTKFVITGRAAPVESLHFWEEKDWVLDPEVPEGGLPVTPLHRFDHLPPTSTRQYAKSAGPVWSPIGGGLGVWSLPPPDQNNGENAPKFTPDGLPQSYSNRSDVMGTHQAIIESSAGSTLGSGSYAGHDTGGGAYFDGTLPTSGGSYGDSHSSSGASYPTGFQPSQQESQFIYPNAPQVHPKGLGVNWRTGLPLVHDITEEMLAIARDPTLEADLLTRDMDERMKRFNERYPSPLLISATRKFDWRYTLFHESPLVRSRIVRHLDPFASPYIRQLEKEGAYNHRVLQQRSPRLFFERFIKLSDNREEIEEKLSRLRHFQRPPAQPSDKFRYYKDWERSLLQQDQQKKLKEKKKARFDLNDPNMRFLAEQVSHKHPAQTVADRLYGHQLAKNNEYTKMRAKQLQTLFGPDLNKLVYDLDRQYELDGVPIADSKTPLMVTRGQETSDFPSQIRDDFDLHNQKIPEGSRLVGLQTSQDYLDRIYGKDSIQVLNNNQPSTLGSGSDFFASLQKHKEKNAAELSNLDFYGDNTSPGGLSSLLNKAKGVVSGIILPTPGGGTQVVNSIHPSLLTSDVNFDNIGGSGSTGGSPFPSSPYTPTQGQNESDHHHKSSNVVVNLAKTTTIDKKMREENDAYFAPKPTFPQLDPSVLIQDFVGNFKAHIPITFNQDGKTVVRPLVDSDPKNAILPTFLRPFQRFFTQITDPNHPRPRHTAPPLPGPISGRVPTLTQDHPLYRSLVESNPGKSMEELQQILQNAYNKTQSERDSARNPMVENVELIVDVPNHRYLDSLKNEPNWQSLKKQSTILHRHDLPLVRFPDGSLPSDTLPWTTDPTAAHHLLYGKSKMGDPTERDQNSPDRIHSMTKFHRTSPLKRMGNWKLDSFRDWNDLVRNAHPNFESLLSGVALEKFQALKREVELQDATLPQVFPALSQFHYRNRPVTNLQGMSKLYHDHRMEMNQRVDEIRILHDYDDNTRFEENDLYRDQMEFNKRFWFRKRSQESRVGAGLTPLDADALYDVISPGGGDSRRQIKQIDDPTEIRRAKVLGARLHAEYEKDGKDLTHIIKDSNQLTLDRYQALQQKQKDAYYARKRETDQKLYRYLIMEGLGDLQLQRENTLIHSFDLEPTHMLPQKMWDTPLAGDRYRNDDYYLGATKDPNYGEGKYVIDPFWHPK